MQLYIALADDRDPKLLGEALTLPASETADTDGYAYSTATLTTDLSAYSKASGSGPTIGPTATLWNPSLNSDWNGICKHDRQDAGDLGAPEHGGGL